MLLFGQDPHEMCDPLHRHPGLKAAAQPEEPDEPADRPIQDEQLEAILKDSLGPRWTLTAAA